jgi:hypothetical protein
VQAAQVSIGQHAAFISGDFCNCPELINLPTQLNCATSVQLSWHYVCVGRTVLEAEVAVRKKSLSARRYEEARSIDALLD